MLLFRDGIKFVIDVVGARRVTKITTTAGVMAVFVRAYTSGEDHEKLRYALNYLIDGGNAIEKGEVARLPGTDSLTRLRDYILTKRFTSAGGSAGKEIYGKTEKMLKAFLEGRDLKKVDEATEELFPVDTSGIIEKPTEAEQQASILGQKLNTVLDQWAGEVTPGYIRPTELVNDLICAGALLVPTLLSLANSPRSPGKWVKSSWVKPIWFLVLMIVSGFTSTRSSNISLNKKGTRPRVPFLLRIILILRIAFLVHQPMPCVR